jgi:two-component system, sensor histidine kinase
MSVDPVKFVVSEMASEGGQGNTYLATMRNTPMARTFYAIPVEPAGGLDHRFCEVMDAAPVMIWVSRADKLCSWFNKPWLAFTGRTMEAEIGNGWAEGVHRDDYDRCLETYVKLFDRREEFRMQYRLRRLDGAYRWIDDIGIPRYAHDGEFLGYIGSCIDIHVQRATEEELRSVKELLERELTRTTGEFDVLVQSIKDHAIYMLDPEGRIIRWNSGAELITGYSAQQIIGQNHSCFFTPKDQRAGIPKLALIEAAREGRFESECLAVRKDGSQFWVNVVINPIFNQQGELIGFAEISRDMTEKRLAQNLLDQARQTKDRILATASHDLRQPLQTLSLLNGVLRRIPADTRVSSAVQGQEQAIAAMAELLDSLLDISKLETGTIKPQLCDVELDGLFEELNIEFAGIAASKGLAFEIVGCDAIAHTDPKLLGQILRNLLSNAFKFTHEGSVQMKCEREDGHLRLSVTDTGAGISSEHLPHIFDEFYQAEIPTNTVREGHGLGLSIVQRLSQLLDHQILVDSRIGLGSNFSMILPIGLEPSHKIQSAKIDLSQNAIGDEHVMVVDDNPTVLAATCSLLESVGYRVTAVSSIAEALKQAHADNDITVLVADYHLANGERGTEAIRAIRSVLGQYLRGLLLTGDTSSGMQKAAREHEVRLISKPIKADEFLALLAGS